MAGVSHRTYSPHCGRSSNSTNISITFQLSRSAKFCSTSTTFLVIVLLVMFDVGQAQLTFSLPGKWGSGRKRSDLTLLNVERLLANRRMHLIDSGRTSRNWAMTSPADNIEYGDDSDLDRLHAESLRAMNGDGFWLKRISASEGNFDDTGSRRDSYNQKQRVHGASATDSWRSGSPENDIESELQRNSNYREVCHCLLMFETLVSIV